MEDNLISFDTETLKKIESKNGLSITFSFPEKKVINTINALMANILGEVDKVFLLNSIITILRECILNAAKANSKRLFFEVHNADLNDPGSYEKTIEKFKNTIVGDFNSIKKDLTESKYSVLLNILKKDKALFITIKNNSVIIDTELKRINERIKNAHKFKDFSQAYENMYDDTEGAGLGIILTIMLLKNCGIAAESFSITSDDHYTYTSFQIPAELKQEKIITEIKNKIMEQVNLLPTFPQNIVELQRLCENEEASINVISDKIKLDTSLSADILKLANSAGFAGVQKIETIHDALVRIGLSNLKHILIAASSQKILEARYKRFESIWAHCMKVAYYARHIAKRYKMNNSMELIFVAGLLHDIGKIILLSVDLSLTNWIADFVKHRKIRTTTILEEVSIGISHSAIGGFIAKRWNFPAFLHDAIINHHSPLSSQDSNREIIFTTYLANQFSGIEEKKYHYQYLDMEVRKFFKLTDENSCINLHEMIKTSFNNHLNR